MKMGILTSRKKSQDFAVYILVFGLSLLVTSIIYFKRLESAWNYEQCNYMFEDENDLCGQLCIWTVCAGMGIGIGLLHILSFLFLVCYVKNWICVPDFGYRLSFLENEKNENERDQPFLRNYFDVNKNKTERSIVKTSQINGAYSPLCISPDFQNRIPTERIKIFPSTRRWLKFELISWILFILMPLAGTVFLVVVLYETDAFRTADENLYHPGLALFLTSILNLLIFCQQFLWSLCRKFCRKFKKDYMKSMNTSIMDLSQVTSE